MSFEAMLLKGISEKGDKIEYLRKRIAELEAQLAMLTAENAKLTRKGKELCCHYGNLYYQNHEFLALLDRAIAVMETHLADKTSYDNTSYSLIEEMNKIIKLYRAPKED